MLEARQLTKSYNGQVALQSLDLQVQPGEVFCLLGANGAGKTTTINLFLHFIEPTSGAAYVNGLNVAEHPLETKKFLAYIPEQVMLYRNLTGVENLQYFAALNGVKRSEKELLQILVESGLEKEAAVRRVGEYSKGMRQKVGIAIARAKEVRALLLDEPTSGLDPKASNEFSELILRLREQGVAILMATHDLFRAKESGTRVGIMREGVLLQTLETNAVSHTELERWYLGHMELGAATT